jgi:hypothetical protein
VPRLLLPQHSVFHGVEVLVLLLQSLSSHLTLLELCLQLVDLHQQIPSVEFDLQVQLVVSLGE